MFAQSPSSRSSPRRGPPARAWRNGSGADGRYAPGAPTDGPPEVEPGAARSQMVGDDQRGVLTPEPERVHLDRGEREVTRPRGHQIELHRRVDLGRAASVRE